MTGSLDIVISECDPMCLYASAKILYSSATHHYKSIVYILQQCELTFAVIRMRSVFVDKIEDPASTGKISGVQDAPSLGG